VSDRRLSPACHFGIPSTPPSALAPWVSDKKSQNAAILTLHNPASVGQHGGLGGDALEKCSTGETPVTEAEWLACDDPQKMLEFLRGKMSDRKMRLFAVACCRRVAYMVFEDPEHADWVAAIRDSVPVGELLADGLASRQELERCGAYDFSGWRLAGAFLACSDPQATFYKVPSDILFDVQEFAFDYWEAGAGRYTTYKATRDERMMRAEAAEAAERAAQTNILRDIFGNPFRPVTCNPAWQTANVVALAQAIYDERAFDRMPILGDALEDAGCDNADILTHCRQPAEHVRGCWVVDLILGKK
jgi:hypothetical protein